MSELATKTLWDRLSKASAIIEELAMAAGEDLAEGPRGRELLIRAHKVTLDGKGQPLFQRSEGFRGMVEAAKAKA